MCQATDDDDDAHLVGELNEMERTAKAEVEHMASEVVNEVENFSTIRTKGVYTLDDLSGKTLSNDTVSRQDHWCAMNRFFQIRIS